MRKGGGGDIREGTICFCHDAILRGKFQNVLPRRVVVRVDADLRQPSECAGEREVGWMQWAGLTHLVHGGEHFSHLHDTAQPFEGKVTHAYASAGRTTRERC